MQISIVMGKIGLILGFALWILASTNAQERIPDKKSFDLPDPQFKSEYSVEEALKSRRSVRHYKDESITLEELAQVLWAAQGKTSSHGWRTAPSAGALYPIEIFVAAAKVDSLSPGVYQYISRSHKLKRIRDGDMRLDIYRSALQQDAFRRAPIVLVICGVYERTTQKYGQRSERYVHIEAGHVGQNVYLQCESIGLGTVVIGAFQDKEIRDKLGLGKRDRPLVLMPVGRKR